jgi:hypothetical protein
MLSSGMCRHVGLVRNDVTEESVASLIRVKIIREVKTALAETSRIGHSIVFLLSVVQSASYC